jgi:hypothetical protein
MAPLQEITNETVVIQEHAGVQKTLLQHRKHFFEAPESQQDGTC